MRRNSDPVARQTVPQTPQCPRPVPQRRVITTPRHPPCPPFLRGGDWRGVFAPFVCRPLSLRHQRTSLELPVVPAIRSGAPSPLRSASATSQAPGIVWRAIVNRRHSGSLEGAPLFLYQ
jgi:hypothetical protein